MFSPREKTDWSDKNTCLCGPCEENLATYVYLPVKRTIVGLSIFLDIIRIINHYLEKAIKRVGLVLDIKVPAFEDAKIIHKRFLISLDLSIRSLTQLFENILNRELLALYQKSQQSPFEKLLQTDDHFAISLS